MYFIYDDYYLKHENGMSHPENPERLKYIKHKADSLAEEGIIEYIKPVPAQAVQIEMVHHPEYIKMVEQLSEEGGLSFLDMDTGVNQYTYSCALLAAGGCFKGMDLILGDGNKYRKFFLAGRPPGHHAFPSRGSGFCIFNNAALGARFASFKYGIKKTAIVDFDAHHGNGTQDIFYEDDSVLYISFHQYPHYPGSGDVGETGYGKGEGFNLNLPFVPGTREPDYLVALIDIILPLVQKFSPEIVIISAGYDSHSSDYMSSLGLVEGSYQKIMNAMSLVAQQYCEGRMAIVLEGGYEYQSTAESVAATIMGSKEVETKDNLRSIDDLERYFDIDKDYRNNRVKNSMILEQVKKTFGLQT
jgi:acetoin utilization deacetylase AcuC-like enzyme